VAPSPNG